MSKTLILFRHAHAEWQSDNDHNRPLSIRGEQEAKKIGQLLSHRHSPPQQLICSSAVRAESTASIANTSGDWMCFLQVDKALYNTDASSALNYIKSLSNNKERIMLVGHEPTWSDLSNDLLIEKQKLVFSTGMMVAINFELSYWSEIEIGKGKLAWVLGPN
ncbi:MAG: histidine phosphatase family protein [Thiohalomonadales bacterium]